MAARHAAQTIRGPLSISGFARRVVSVPTLGAFLVRGRRGLPSLETPCAANSECFCNSDSWRARGYVTSATAQINEATARPRVRDVEAYAKIRRVDRPQKTSRASLKSDSSGPRKKCRLS